MSRDKKGPPMTQSKLEDWRWTEPEGHTGIYGKLVSGNTLIARAVMDADDPCIYVTHPQAAKLIAEAGTVCNRTGLTPGELEKERDYYKHKVDVLQARIDQLNRAVQWRDVVEQDEDRDEEAATKANEDVCWAIRQCQILASITDHDKKLRAEFDALTSTESPR